MNRYMYVHIMYILFILTSAVVAVDSSHMTASSSASRSSFSPPSSFVSGHMSTMWFMVCRWSQSQEGDWARPHLCRFDDMGVGRLETVEQ